jgi:hypothetical protein
MEKEFDKADSKVYPVLHAIISGLVAFILKLLRAKEGTQEAGSGIHKQ